MKPSLRLALLLVAGILSAASAPAQTLLLSYGFNGSLTNAGGATGADLVYRNTSGTVTSSYGTGVAGGTSTALDNTGAGAMGSAGNNTAGAATASQSAAFGALGTLGSFTIAGWYNAAAQAGNNAQILSLVGTNTITLTAPSSNDGRLALSYNGTQITNSLQETAYASTSQWVFFAMTYDGTTGTANFYVGGTTGSLLSAGTRTGLSLTGDVTLGSSIGIGVGNGYSGNGTANRPFDGLLDNVALYGGAAGTASGVLTSSQIDALRLQSVPEPGSMALVLGGFAALLLALKAFSAVRS